MKDLGRRGLALLLTLLMVVSLVPTAFADEADLTSASEEVAAVETVAEETAEETPAEVPEEAPAEEEPAVEETVDEEIAAPVEETVTSDPADLVDAPTNITAVNAMNGIKVTWNKVTGSVSYYLVARKVKGEDDTHWENVATVAASADPIYTDNSVSNDVEYCYTVGVQETGGSSSYNYKSYCTVRAVTAPTNIKLTNVTDGVTVTWDAMSNADCYRIYRRADGTAEGSWSQIAEVSSSTTSYTDTDASLVSGNAYYYTVRTIRKTTGEEGIYDSVGVKTIYFGVPKVTSAENGETGVVVTYTSVANATEYRLYRKVSGTDVWSYVSSSTSNTITDTGAVSGKNYYYTVTAYDHNTDTESVKSEPGYGPIQYLAMPQLATPTCNETSVTLTWAAVSGATGYNVYRREDGGTFSLIANKITTNTYTDKNLTAGKIYYYTVQAVSGTTVSAKSPVGSLGLALPTPEISLITNETEGIRLQWNRIEGINDYYVYRSTDKGTTYERIGTTHCETGSLATYTDSKVTNGTTYYYAVQSVYLSGVTSNDRMGKLSTPWKEQTRVGSTVMISAANSQNGITVTWNSVAGASGYNVYRQVVTDSGSGDWISVGTTTATSLTDPDSNLTYGSTYRYSVAAVRGTTEGIYGVDYKTVTRLKTVDFNLKNTTDGIKISWYKVAGASYYNVYRKTANSGWKNVKSGLTDLSWTDDKSGLENGVTYTYTVRAVNSKTSSLSWYDGAGKSMIWYTAPTLTSITNTVNGIYVTWKAPTNVTVSSYTVYRKINDGAWINVTDVTGTSYTDTDVTNNNKYTYTVQAHVNGTNGSWDTTGLTITFVSTPILVSAANTSAPSAGSGKIKVTWLAVEGVDSYQVWRKVNGGSWSRIVDSTTEISYEDNNVDIGTTYCYTIRAVKNGYLSNYDHTGKTVICLATPALYSAIGNSDRIRIVWSVCGGATGYNVYRKTATTNWNLIGTTSSNWYEDYSSDCGVAYTYTVRATKDSDISYYDTNGKTGMRLATPTVNYAENAIVSNVSGVKVSWNAVDGAERYNIYRTVTGKNSWDRVGIVNASDGTTFVDTSSLTPNTNYTYTVRACYTGSYNIVSMSGFDSNGAKVNYYPTPTGSLSSNTTSITVTWTAVPNATTYNVYRKLPGGNWERIAIIQASDNILTYTDTKMALKTNYEYTVRANCGGTMSGFASFGTIATK